MYSRYLKMLDVITIIVVYEKEEKNPFIITLLKTT